MDTLNAIADLIQEYQNKHDDLKWTMYICPDDRPEFDKMMNEITRFQSAPTSEINNKINILSINGITINVYDVRGSHSFMIRDKVKNLDYKWDRNDIRLIKFKKDDTEWTNEETKDKK